MTRRWMGRPEDRSFSLFGGNVFGGCDFGRFFIGFRTILGKIYLVGRVEMCNFGSAT